MKTIILNVTFLLLGVCLMAQTVHTVDNRPGTTAQYSTVQAAINASSVGDFIYVHPSPNTYGQIIIDREIHLRGIGHGPELANGEFALIDGLIFGHNTTNNTNASNSSVSGLKIKSISDNNQVVYSNITIQNNYISGGSGIYFYKAFNYIIQGNIFTEKALFFVSAHGNNLISNNIFIKKDDIQGGMITSLGSTETFSNNLIIFENSSNDKMLFQDCSNPIVNNNMIVFSSVNTTATSLNNLNSTINYQNCLTFAYGGQTLTVLTGTNNLNNINPLFVNIGSPANPNFSYAKNYKLASGSPAINAGSDGSNLGVFGQGFLFQMKGYPFDLPYPTSININNAVVAAGSNLEVVLKAKANVEN